MIITKFLRCCGWSIWTREELEEELTKLVQEPPKPDPVSKVTSEYVNLDKVIRNGK